MSIDQTEKRELIKHVIFLETELSDFSYFKKVDWKKYNEDRNTRRNIERWIENIINCSIDIAKLLIVIEKLNIPQTYREILRALGATPYFDEKFGNEISKWTELRNIVTHDYLDISWARIQRFLESAEPVARQLVGVVNKIVKA
ncbi:MAG: HepT-like ribonuclease domain-containing protein [Pseudomonadota bacterium]